MSATQTLKSLALALITCLAISGNGAQVRKSETTNRPAIVAKA